jgi:hypothetical protein
MKITKNLTYILIFFPGLLCLLQQKVVGQATTTWNGSVSAIWTDPTNWNNGVPDATVNVVIPSSGVTNYPSLISVSFASPDIGLANDLSIQSGASITLNMYAGLEVYGQFSNEGTLTINNSRSFGITVYGTTTNDGTFNNNTYLGTTGAQIKLEGDLINNGTFSSLEHIYLSGDLENNASFNAGNVHFMLDGGPGTVDYSINGSTPASIGSLTVAKESTYTVNLTLNTTVNIDGTVTFIDGKIFLGNNNLILSSGSGFAGMDGDNFIVTDGTGVVTRENQSGFSYEIFPVGPDASNYTPLTIQNRGTADDFSVQVSSQIFDGGTTGTAYQEGSVGLTWFIEEAVPGGSDVYLTLEWSTSNELDAFTRDLCTVAHFNGSFWEAVGNMVSAQPSVGTGTDYILYAYNISDFSPFGIVSSGSILPVLLTSFEVTESDGQAILNWETAEELNNDYFELQHSVNGFDFKEIATIDGQGTIDHAFKYSYLHPNPQRGQNYYRLRQVDFDGQSNLSRTITLFYTGDTDGHLLSVYPNPVNTCIRLMISQNGHFRTRITDRLGRIVYSGVVEGGREHAINMSHLPKGVYVLACEMPGREMSKKLIVE